MRGIFMAHWFLKNNDGLFCHIIHGNSREALKDFVNCADLIMTSPPYADARKKLYDSIKPDEYAAWFYQFHAVFWNALKASGSLVINLKDKIVDGIRHRYVWETIQQLNQVGWLSVDDYLWHKKTAMPGRISVRLRDSWEYIFHLSKIKKPYFNVASVKIPISEAVRIKISKINEHYICKPSSTGSGFMRDLKAWQNKEFVSPTNVLHLCPENHNRRHPAVYPVSLPLFFIKLLSKPNGVIIDPFSGSGSTGVAAIRAGRNCLLIDNKYEYCEVAKERLEKECGMILARKNKDVYDKNLFARSIAQPYPGPLDLALT